LELSDLAAYAEEKYHIEEQHKWADFPGFSVLNDPRTGKWAALLMRQWDSETGTEIQRCDIKCGREVLSELKAPYLAPPFRMKGIKWVGVKFDETTDPEVVFELFDTALEDGERKAFEAGEKERGASLIVLEELKGLKGFHDSRKTYGETALPPADSRPRVRINTSGAGPGEFRIPGEKTAGSGADPFSKTASPDSFSKTSGAYTDPGRTYRSSWYDKIPLKIREMMELYRHGDGSFENKCRNFYVQGKFMEDYEDNAPWTGECRRYFTTYHDLNADQLRGYFSWRTRVRRGEFRRIPASLAYLYLYELLSGIGTDSAEDCLSKLKAFEAGYLDAGFGDPSMRVNLHRWMAEYAVVHGGPPEYLPAYVGRDLLKRDEALMKLSAPQDYTDEEVFYALSQVTDGKIESSPVITKEGGRGVHLLAEVWKYLTKNYELDGWDIFTACFGKLKEFPWHPFANAVYYSERREEDREYVLSGCRKYICRNGVWTEARYDELFFDKYRVHAVVRAADRLLRRYLKTGHYLRGRKDEEWIVPYIEAVIEADKAAVLEAEREAERAAAEAAKPKVTIDLSGLDRIRRDAAITRESLLTEEEKAEFREEHPAPVQSELPIPEKDTFERSELPVPEKDGAAGTETSASVPAETVTPVELTATAPAEAAAHVQFAAPTPAQFAGLDSIHTQILAEVMRGGAVSGLIRENHLMPSVVADAINEALFDEIGDNVLICDGNEIELVEDYRLDLEDLLGDI